MYLSFVSVPSFVCRLKETHAVCFCDHKLILIFSCAFKCFDLLITFATRVTQKLHILRN